MDDVAGLLAGYPFDVLLGSVHWVGGWRFDDLDDPASMAEWSVRQVDACWEAYTEALEELAASGACDVLAHPDLIKAAGYVPDAPAEWWDRIAEAAVASGMAAEVSSAGWRKPVGEQYPALGLLERFVAGGVPLTTASDAHRLEHVADRADDLRAVLGAAGAGVLQGYRGRTRLPGPGVGRSGARGEGADADAGRAGAEPHRPQARGARAPAAAARELERAGRPLLLRPAAPGAGARRRRPATARDGRRTAPGDAARTRRTRTPSWWCSARCARTTGPPWSTRTWWARR